MPHQLHDAIPTVMSQFNFEEVHKVMTSLNWTWGNGRVPTVEELRECAEKLLKICVDSWIIDDCDPHGALVATGGFETRVDVYRGGHPELVLLFYVNRTTDSGEMYDDS